MHEIYSFWRLPIYRKIVLQQKKHIFACGSFFKSVAFVPTSYNSRTVALHVFLLVAVFFGDHTDHI